jgi:hypothetical protein
MCILRGIIDLTGTASENNPSQSTDDRLGVLHRGGAPEGMLPYQAKRHAGSEEKPARRVQQPPEFNGC